MGRDGGTIVESSDTGSSKLIKAQTSVISTKSGMLSSSKESKFIQACLTLCGRHASEEWQEEGLDMLVLPLSNGWARRLWGQMKVGNWKCRHRSKQSFISYTKQ